LFLASLLPARFWPTGQNLWGALLGAALLTSGCARKHFFQPDARPTAVAAQPLSAAADSVRSLTAGRQYARHGRLYEALIGRHHRPSWGAPVTAPVLHLTTVVPGGFTAGKLGGGFNSTSLSLNTPDNKRYVLRTVDKDPSRAIPLWLRGTFLTNALRDNISATNPYAALTVPPLAASLGIPYTSPRVFYVRPDDPIFAPDSLLRFRGQLGLLEEKFSGRAVPVPALGVVDVASSTDVFHQLFGSPASYIDQAALMRARLFDAWLGDWDRHEGQWSWAALSDKNGRTRYQALPKDRDMVFYRLDDGMVGWLVGHVIKRPWNTFAPKFTNVRGLLHNGQYLDIRALNTLNRRQFLAAATAMQQRLPDTLLTRALRRLPPSVLALEGARTLATLQARRAALPEFAANFYREIAERPKVGGTALAERFDIVRYADSTVVTVTSLAPPASVNTSSLVIFRRTFLPGETKTIQLDGLGGNDVFVLKNGPGPATARPRLRIYGGLGKDLLQGDAAKRGVRFSQGPAPQRAAFDKEPKE
jgi:hypothetical protein